MGNRTIYSVNVSDSRMVATVRETRCFRLPAPWFQTCQCARCCGGVRMAEPGLDMLHVCNGCRKLLAAATPTVVLDVWTNSLAANFTPSVFWDRVFASGALNSIGPRQAQWTGTFLNATTYLVRLCLTCLPLSRGVLTDCDCGRACCRKTRTKPLLGAFKTHRSLAMQGGCPCTFRHHLLSVHRQTDAGMSGYGRQKAIVSSRSIPCRATAGGSGGLSAGAIVGIVLGAIVGTAALIAGKSMYMHVMPLMGCTP